MSKKNSPVLNEITRDIADATGQTVSEVREEAGIPEKPVLKFKKKRRISQNQLKLQIGVPVYVQIEGTFHEGKKLDDKRDPATLAEVIDLETGENALIVVPSVVKSSIEEQYPNEKYVGLQFEIEKLQKDNPDKKYFPYRVTEIEVDA